LTASHSASPSSSAPEEFPVEPKQVEGNEPGSSDSIPLSAVAVETNASPSPEEPSREPGEDEAPLSTKPLPKVNAVAHEVRVKATGARPGELAGDRELFTESTSTVLVFEKGAVIRLAAAVTPGQLLFLTNEESKREVVAQVIRKRTFRPTECYVELEFTEPAQGFWGMEFSAATALLPKDAAQAAAAELVASAETTADEPGEAAPPPSAEEISALKKEVDALRSQLKLLQAQPTAEQGAAATAIPDAGSPPVTTAPQVDATIPAGAATSSFASAAKSTPVESEPHSPSTTAAYQELPQPAWDFRASLPKRKRSFRARGNFTPGFRTGALRLAFLVVALFLTITGAAWYKHWLPGMHEPKKIPVASWAGGVTTLKPVPKVQAPASGVSEGQSRDSESGKNTDATVSSDTVAKAHASSNETENQVPFSSDTGVDSSLPGERESPPAIRGKHTPSAPMDRSTGRAPKVALADSVPDSAMDSVIVPPKLIRSVRAVASLDDLRDFETGSVMIDAVIDTEGDVRSMNVLSGPPSLRRPALEALKSYRYEPATQNGKRVPAHVTVKIQFHFE
jgi:TonB family protein